ncbi:MAG: hypothetical protein ACTSUX_07120 [Promethearchaeota archaeon]
MAKISKVLEIDNCNKEDLLKVIYNAKFWEEITPTTEVNAEFIAPNVLYSRIKDQISLINVPIEMEGELVLTDLGEQEGKGKLIELNVRNNKNVRKLEGRLRVKALSQNKTKIGVFIDTLILDSEFLNLFGGAADLTLQRKITEILRNLEKICKNNKLREFL